MDKSEKLFKKAKNSPNNLRFRELCSLAELVGFIKKKRKAGSHITYLNPKTGERLTFQEGKSDQAKSYQVRQLLTSIEEFDLKPVSIGR